jgi:DNA-binding transcriptional MerR regulator
VKSFSEIDRSIVEHMTAGVTIKTIRHYHKLGVLDEPPRDRSGYRRYGSAELLKLVQSRTLAAAGVPLGEIRQLLDSDKDAMMAELDTVERRLTARIAELTSQRRMLRKLTSGDHMLLPDRAVAMLRGMPTLGFSSHDLKTAQESFVLARALIPDKFDEYLTDVEQALEDPRFVELTRRSAEVINWEPDDPRVDRLANDMAEHYLAHPKQLKIVTGLQAPTETATRYRLVAHHREQHASAAARLAYLLEARLRAGGATIPGAG